MRLLVPLLLASLAVQAAPNVALEPVASGFVSPIGIANAGDSRLFVIEQDGRIRIFDGTSVLPEPFLDIRSLVSSGGERGLLGLAFHPRYSENGFFYVNYTDLAGDTMIARYSVSSTDADRADPASAQVVLQVQQPFPTHNGGQLQFGPDGYLYIGLGDGGGTGDPLNNAQNRTSLLGKILRIDVDNGAPYGIPPSNPFADVDDARREVWALGLRNPWRFSFDRVTGDLWIADVGQADWEEVNFQAASSIGGENYGWRRMEGRHCYEPSSGCEDPSLVVPVIEYQHAPRVCSVTGGYVYRGSRNVRLRGVYIYADLCSSTFWGATRDLQTGAVTTEVLLDLDGFATTSFGESVEGELYVVEYLTGALFRIVDTAPLQSRRRAVRK
jgi:glucose/arabinose dehydrogenase